MNDSFSDHSTRVVLLLLVLFVAGAARSAFAQGTAFTYQGRLQDSGTSANGNYDFQFTLWDALSGGTQQPQPAPVTVTKSNVVVTNGVFTTQLDFGAAAFSGADRFLETSVRLNGTANFTLLSPRQPITSTPYAVRSASSSSADIAATANNATQLGGVAANQYVITTDSRLTDPRAPTAGSANYIQNTTTQQASSNFNVSGNGTAGGTLSANSVNATTQYNLNNLRTLSVSGGSNQFQNSNTFVGVDAGTSTAPAAASTSGNFNAFLGIGSGHANTNGSENSFFGAYSGYANTTGQGNSFFGDFAGNSNTTGINNAFFGSGAGYSNTTASLNSFFGQQSGNSNTTGNNNSFFGTISGIANTTGGLNSFFGTAAGEGNTTGSLNSFFGAYAGPSSNGSQNSFFGSSSGDSNSSGNNNSYFGYWTGHNTNGNGNSFVGSLTGGSTTSGNYNSFFGYSAGGSNLTGTSNSMFGDNANVGAGNLTNATAIGSHAFVNASNSLILGSISGINGATANTAVGIGTSSPSASLDVRGRVFFGTPGTNGVRITPQSDADSNVLNVTNAANSLNWFSVGNNGQVIMNGGGNVGIGTNAPTATLHVFGTTGLIGNVGIGTASPADALEVQRNSTVASDWTTGQLRISGASDPNMRLNLGYDTSSNLGVIQAGQAGTSYTNLSLNPSGGNVGIGTTSPSAKLHVNGVIRMDALGAPAGIFPLCWNVNDQIASCTSSSLRYKASVQTFTGGLGIVNRLRPISFTWREGGMHDLGLAAEEVEKVEPLLTYRNKQGQIEGVRYNQLSAVFINAFKEQQAQIQQQQDELKRQQEQIKRQAELARQQRAALAAQQQQLNALKKLVCGSHRRATLCR